MDTCCQWNQWVKFRNAFHECTWINFAFGWHRMQNKWNKANSNRNLNGGEWVERVCASVRAYKAHIFFTHSRYLSISLITTLRHFIGIYIYAWRISRFYVVLLTIAPSTETWEHTKYVARPRGFHDETAPAAAAAATDATVVVVVAAAVYARACWTLQQYDKMTVPHFCTCTHKSTQNKESCVWLRVKSLTGDEKVKRDELNQWKCT